MFSVQMLARARQFQTTRLLQHLTVAPSGARVRLIDETIKRLIACGAWYKMDGFYVLAAHTPQAATLNWINPASGVGTLQGAPAFVADRGYTGDGTTTGFQMAPTLTRYLQDSAHAGVFALTTTTDASLADIGSEGSTRLGIRARTTTNASFRINSATTSAATTGPAAYPAYMLTHRVASTDQLLYVNGVQDTTAAVASSGSVTAFGLGFTSTSGATDRQIACGHMGGAMTDGEITGAYRAILGYMQAIGAA